jgi:hypothetical protein
MPDLIVVVDPNYGDRLETAVETAPVWIVASPNNRSACQRIWAADPAANHREFNSVTIYDVADPNDRLDNLLSVFPTLEEHHGEIHAEQFSFPNGFVIEVRGLAPAEALNAALRDLGFSAITETAEGLAASK